MSLITRIFFTYFYLSKKNKTSNEKKSFIKLVCLMIFVLWSNYRKLSADEIISKDCRINYNKILEQNKNVVSVFDNTPSKLFYTDKNGFGMRLNG